MTSATPGQKLLFVEDDTDLLEISTNILSGAGFSVATAHNGEEAVAKLGAETFPIVISDINMPKYSGIDLLKWIRTNRPSMKVVLVTGFGDLAQTKTAADLGCDAFLAKPVSKGDLINVVKAMLIPTETAEFREADFARVAIDDFISGREIAYALFIRLADGRFLKIAHSGKDMDLDRIQSLKMRDVNELWLTRDDFNKYAELSHKITKFAAHDQKLGREKRARLISHACEVAAEQLRLCGLGQESLAQATYVFEHCVNVILTGKLGLEFLESLDSRGATPYSHASVCGMLCGLLTRVMGWSSKRNIVTLTMGGFLHDIGMAHLPLEIQTADPEKLSPEQLQIYKKHPRLGADQLSKMPNVPSELVLIVLQHHENARGTGFPTGLLRSDIFPMARIVSLVDRFCHRFLRSKQKSKANALAILKKLMEEERGFYDETAVLSLSILFEASDLKKAEEQFKKEAKRLVI